MSQLHNMGAERHAWVQLTSGLPDRHAVVHDQNIHRPVGAHLFNVAGIARVVDGLGL